MNRHKFQALRMNLSTPFRIPQKEILCDLDGSIVDYEKGVGQLLGIDIAALRKDAGKNAPFNTHKLIGTTLERIVSTIHKGETGDAAKERMREFWANLPAFPGAISFLDKTCLIAPVRIVTQPYPHPGSEEGKSDWLVKHGFGNLPIVFTDPETGARDHLAHRLAALVDDNDTHLTAFRNAGGHPVCIPRPWNAQSLAASSSFAYSIALASLRARLA
jgi:hypothetical protein